jgi:hypothetical protein
LCKKKPLPLHGAEVIILANFFGKAVMVDFITLMFGNILSPWQREVNWKKITKREKSLIRPEPGKRLLFGPLLGNLTGTSRR